MIRIAHWYNQINRSDFLSFGTVVRTIQAHYSNIVVVFKRRSTNAASKSFNAKIKDLRAQLREVRDIAFSYSYLLIFMLKIKFPQNFGMPPYSPYSVQIIPVYIKYDKRVFIIYIDFQEVFSLYYISHYLLYQELSSRINQQV